MATPPQQQQPCPPATIPSSSRKNRPPKNAIRCDCQWAHTECHETQLRLYQNNPSSKFFGYSRFRLPVFLNGDFDEDKLLAHEKKKLHITRRLMCLLGIGEDKLKKDMLHISKHHWRESALDYVRSRGEKFSMTHIYEFDSREDWLAVTMVDDEADIMTTSPKIRAFLSPNNPVHEWPALYQSNHPVPTSAPLNLGLSPSLVYSGHTTAPSDQNIQDSLVEYDVDQDGVLPSWGSQHGTTFNQNISGANSNSQQLQNTTAAAFGGINTHQLQLEGLNFILPGKHTFASSGGRGTLEQQSLQGNRNIYLPPTSISNPGIQSNNSFSTPFKQWIHNAKLSLQNITGQSAISSRAYLESAIKIAKCLAEQIAEAERAAEEDGDFNDLNSFPVRKFAEVDSLPICSSSEWADCIVIRFEKVPSTNNQEDQKGNSAQCQMSGESSNSPQVNIDQKLEQLYLEPFGQDNNSLSIANSKGNGYLKIVSAKFQCEKNEERVAYKSIDTNIEKVQRIYCLGLVLWELFSGGESPPPSVVALSFCDNAFVSLSTNSLVETNNDDGESVSTYPKRHQSHTGAKESSLCQSSCEYLRFIGVTSQISCLILNMLDCVYGDLAGKDCYSNMTDVVSDLQLMLDKPSKFLWGTTLDTFSSDLQSSDMNIQREDEFETIKSCFRRCVTGSCEVAIIKGESGSGKSWMAHRIGSTVIREGSIFLASKFDQMNQVTPFSALASVFGQYCDLIFDAKDSEWAKTILEKLKTALGRDSCHLISVVPKLGLILDSNADENDFIINTNSENAVQRLHHLFSILLEVMTENSLSITLCFDDVQWADQASISVLNRLLIQRKKKFFFLGCCREDELGGDHLFSKMLENVSSAGVNVTTIELKNMGEDVLNTVLSDLLCLSPRIVRQLSDIVHSKTHGNILFFSQLLLSLYRDRLLYFDYDRHRWVWDEDTILSMKLPDDVALCFSNGINKLPLEVQGALHTLSMFGVSAKFEYMQLIESQIGLDLVNPLKRAASEGLVIKQKGSYQFSHDSIQESSYKMIGDPVRKNNHLMFGRCLVQQAIDDNDNDMLFVAVNQINLAGLSANLENDEYIAMSKHNLAAGKKAMAMPAFSAAHSFFTNGISFLNGKNYWRDHYSIGLELYELASKSALAAGSIHNVESLLDEIIENATSFEDTLNAHFMKVCSLAVHPSNVRRALEYGLSFASKLGEGIPNNASQEILQQHVQHTLSMISGISEVDILNYPKMTDRKKLMTMKLLARLQASSYYADPVVHNFIILKMVQLTLSSGLSPVAPFGFVCFGSFIAKIGDLAAGHRLSLLAKSLLTSPDTKDFAGSVISRLAEISSYVEPLPAANELRIQGEVAAISVGDTQSACVCRCLYVFNRYWTGGQLSIVDDLFTKAQQFMMEQEFTAPLGFLLVMKTTASAFVEVNSDIAHLQSTNSQQVTLFPFFASFHNMYLTLVFNKSDLKHHTSAYFESDTRSGFLWSTDLFSEFIAGLASFKVYRDTTDPVWASRGKKCKDQMKIWNEQGATWNFQHRLQLLEAEEHYSNFEFDLAKVSYINAITSARSSRFVNDEALASELAGRFYLETGDRVSSLEYLRVAHTKYSEWGAVGKANRLFEYITETFAP